MLISLPCRGESRVRILCLMRQGLRRAFNMLPDNVHRQVIQSVKVEELQLIKHGTQGHHLRAGHLAPVL